MQKVLFLLIQYFFKCVVNKIGYFSIFLEAFFSKEEEILLEINEFEDILFGLSFDKVLFSGLNDGFKFILEKFKCSIFKFKSEVPEDL